VQHYGSLYEGFEAASKRGAAALKEAGVDPNVAEVLSEIAKEKIVVRGVTVQGVFEASTMSSYGIQEIKDAFQKVEEVAEENDAAVSITTLGAPKYRIQLTADDYKRAEYALDVVIKFVEEVWENIDGSIAFTRE